jgi:hypothetical protein
MNVRLGNPVHILALLLLAACGGGEETLTLRGDFAGSAGLPDAVRAVEAGRDARVSGGAFELGGLSAGPVTLHLVRGDDVLGRIVIPDPPPGGEVALRGIRVDDESGRAFPASVEVRGADVVRVNGIRMAPEGRVRGEVDEEGSVLGYSHDTGALLFRPSDAGMPDLRVFVGPITETITPDGDPVDVAALAAGDSVRVQGTVQNGMVLAARLTVPRTLAVAQVDAAPASDASNDASGDGGSDDGSDDSGSEGRASAAAAVAPAAAASAARAERGRGRVDNPGRGNGRGNGNGRGGGKKN